MKEVGTLKFTWKIENFSKIQTSNLYSDVSSLGPYKWKIHAYPKGYNKDNHLSIFLNVADPQTLPWCWSRNTKFSLTVVSQIEKKWSVTREFEREFNANHTSLGWSLFISQEELHDPKNGYLVQDTCIIKADITIYEAAAASVECGGKDEPTEEDMDTFFGDLNSVIFPKKIVSSEDEAKEALAVIEEAASNMVAAADLINSTSRMSQLINAFDALSMLDDDGGLILTLEQKAELLSMKDVFIALPQRAAKASQDIKLCNDKELVKQTLDHKLRRCLTEYEKAKAETEQTEHNIATLQAQIDEMKQKKDNSSLKQKELFKVSKEMKTELDVLVTSLPQYEAKKKAAEEEEKVVGKELSKMKQFVSSLKKPSNSSMKPQEKTLSIERLQLISMAAIKEFYSSWDEKKVALWIKDINSPSYHPSMVALWVSDSFQMKDTQRDLLSELLVNLTKSPDANLSPGQLVQGFESVLSGLESVVNECPRAAQFLGLIFSKVVVNEVVALEEIGNLVCEGGEEPGSLIETEIGGDVIGSTLEMIKKAKGETFMNDILGSSNLCLEDFRPPEPNRSMILEKFMDAHSRMMLISWDDYVYV